MDEIHEKRADGSAEFEMSLSELDNPIVLGNKGFASIFKSMIRLAEELSS